MGSGAIRIALVAGTIGAGAMAVWNVGTHWHPSPARFSLQGIDLGERPAAVDWTSLRAQGADFAYLVATSGSATREPTFESNWQALADAGMRRGAVHLYAWCEPGRLQADLFNTTVPVASDALPAAVALDGGGAGCAAYPGTAALLAQLRLFVAAVETHTGKPIVLRIDRAAERRFALTAAINRPAWVLGDFVAPGYAARPWRMWRATTHRHVDGIEGAVAWDVAAP